MTNRYIAFDIETSKVMATGETDWKAQRPLGISCAATLMSDRDEPKLWYSCDPVTGQPLPSMTVKDVQDLIFYLRLSVKTGYKILTWNGLSFDFDVLAEESISMADLCVELALNHIDMMFHVFALRGHYLGLDKAAKGMGLIGKLNGVTGIEAPIMWSQGQHQQVLRYVGQDAKTTLELAQTVERVGRIQWISAKGRLNVVDIPQWLIVNECLNLPKPDTSWMDSPPTREQLMAWTQVATSHLSTRVIDHLSRVFNAYQSNGQVISDRDSYWLKQCQRIGMSNK